MLYNQSLDWYANDIKEKLMLNSGHWRSFGKNEKEKVELIAGTGVIFIMYVQDFNEFAANGWLYPFEELA